MKPPVLPRFSHIYIPFIGTFLTTRAFNLIREYRPSLLTQSQWKIKELIPGKLWLSSLK